MFRLVNWKTHVTEFDGKMVIQLVQEEMRQVGSLERIDRGPEVTSYIVVNDGKVIGYGFARRHNALRGGLPDGWVAAITSKIVIGDKTIKDVTDSLRPAIQELITDDLFENGAWGCTISCVYDTIETTRCHYMAPNIRAQLRRKNPISRKMDTYTHGVGVLDRSILQKQAPWLGNRPGLVLAKNAHNGLYLSARLNQKAHPELYDRVMQIRNMKQEDIYNASNGEFTSFENAYEFGYRGEIARVSETEYLKWRVFPNAYMSYVVEKFAPFEDFDSRIKFCAKVSREGRRTRNSFRHSSPRGPRKEIV